MITQSFIVQAEDLQALLETALSRALAKVTVTPPLHPARKAQAEDSDYLNTAQTCKYLHCSRPYLYKLQREGQVRAYPVGSHNLFRRSELDAFVQSSAKNSKAA